MPSFPKTWKFRDEYHRWGPFAQFTEPTPAEAENYCRWVARTHYENFPVVSWLLPKNLYQHFFNIYAYCRWADDLGDELGDPAESLQALEWWEGELRRCFGGMVRHPVFVALKPTIDRFAIPAEPFHDLLSAFKQDQHVREYATYSELLDYCCRSANPVGRLVLYLGEVFNEENANLSDRICSGLQLTNFWQDVARDATIGRCYLPEEDRLRFGYTEVQRRQCKSTPEFRELLRFEVERTRDLLVSGLPLVKKLPGRLQIDIDLFARGGLRILEKIRDQNYSVWEQRPRLRKWDVLRIVMGAVRRHLWKSSAG